MVAKHPQPPPSYDNVDSDDDDSIPPPPPPMTEGFIDHEQGAEPAKPVKKWRLLKKEAEHVLVPQQEPEPVPEQPYMGEMCMPANSNSNPDIPMQGHFRGIHSAQQFDEEEAGMDEIEVPSSSVVARMNHSERAHAKRKRMCKWAIIGGIAILVLVAIVTGSVFGTRGGGAPAESEGVGDGDVGADPGTGTGTGDNNDVGNDGDGDEIDVPPPQNVNMDTLAGQFLLNNDKIPDSVKANLEDPESTASEALDWVLNDPANAVEYPFDAEGTFDNVLAQIDLTQRLALASIAKSMTVNPDNNWMSEEDVCDWEGIVCGNPDDGAGVEQVAGNIITEIKLNGAEMEGTIPAEIALLPDLERLSFWNNKLSGPIPAELGSMPNLVYIDFDDNELTGQIPPEIFTDRLVDVFLSKNQLTGPIPATIGEMTNVEILWLNNNGLEGGIPDEMGDLQNLKELFLDSNPIFDGLDDPSFPDALKGLGSLVTLNMRNMLMGGPFPQFEAGDFPNLQTLQLDDNLLTGEISDRGIGNLASLVDLSLARNAGLGGDLPLDIQDWDALQFLDLSNCSFQNEIPKEIGMAESLKEVYLNGNELVGELPGAITWLENLDTFVVSDNLDITGLHKAICREMQKLDEPYTLEIGCNVECECCSDVCDA